MVKITNFDHLTMAILKFWLWSWSKMVNFDHLTTDNLKFWPWSWSKIFDHLTMTPGRRPNGQKIMVILPPPYLYTVILTLFRVLSSFPISVIFGQFMNLDMDKLQIIKYIAIKFRFYAESSLFFIFQSKRKKVK